MHSGYGGGLAGPLRVVGFGVRAREPPPPPPGLPPRRRRAFLSFLLLSLSPLPFSLFLSLIRALSSLSPAFACTLPPSLPPLHPPPSLQTPSLPLSPALPLSLQLSGMRECGSERKRRHVCSAARACAPPSPGRGGGCVHPQLPNYPFSSLFPPGYHKFNL